MKEKFNEILSYKVVNSPTSEVVLLKNPVIAPCGHTINKDSIGDKCIVCCEPIKTKDLPKNIALEQVLELIYSLDNIESFAAIEEKLLTILKCPVGIDYFNDPVTISCGHTIESQFLTKLSRPESNTLMCPCCRVIVPADNFSSDIVLAALGDYLATVSKEYRNNRLEITFEQEVKSLIRKQDYKKVNDLLKGQVATFLIDGKPILHFIVSKNISGLLQILIEKDKHILQHRKVKDLFLLHLACELGHLESVKVLISFGCNPLTYMKKYTAVDCAVLHDRVNVIHFLIDHLAGGQKKAIVKIINQGDVNNWTLLHAACSAGKINVAKYLLDNGANINAQNSNKQTALHLAVNNKHREIVELLLAKGANFTIQDKHKKTPAQLFNSNNIFQDIIVAKQKPLVDAVLKNNLDELVIMLKALKSDPLFPCIEKGLLHMAAKSGNLEAVKLLITHGNKPFSYQPLSLVQGFNVLGHGCMGGNLAVVKFLINYLAEVQSKIKIVNEMFLGQTLLHYASRMNQVHIARCLLENGANVNAETTDKMTALHYAVFYNHGDIVQLLLEYDANVSMELVSQVKDAKLKKLLYKHLLAKLDNKLQKLLAVIINLKEILVEVQSKIVEFPQQTDGYMTEARKKSLSLFNEGITTAKIDLASIVIKIMNIKYFCSIDLVNAEEQVQLYIKNNTDVKTIIGDIISSLQKLHDMITLAKGKMGSTVSQFISKTSQALQERLGLVKGVIAEYDVLSLVGRIDSAIHDVEQQTNSYSFI